VVFARLDLGWASWALDAGRALWMCLLASYQAHGPWARPLVARALLAENPRTARALHALHETRF
jgi:hypothetical protein